MDRANTQALMLWTLLRWETKVARAVLLKLGVDLWDMEKKLDALLRKQVQKSGHRIRDDLARSIASGQSEIAQLLDGAQKQATDLGHSYIGTEHILLAILSDPSPQLSSYFHGLGLFHRPVMDAVKAFLHS
jgi:ATP-dependent Clp protease ATP-binding subunit ClpA